VDIILDANILIADYQLSGTAFRVALDGIHRTDSRMCVPEVVVAEVVAKHKEHLALAGSELQKAKASLRRLGHRELADKVIGVEASAYADDFATQLRGTFKATGVLLLPWPSVSHEVVVHRILSGRRPTHTEAGYRDILIWETVLEHIKKTRPPTTVFVTRNSKDFLEEDRLHPHLLQDLVDAEIDPASVSVEQSIESLNKRIFEPTLALLEEAKGQLQEGSFPGFDIRAWLRQTGRDLVGEDDLRGAVTNLPDGCGRVSISGAPIIKEVVILDVRKLSKGDLLVEASVTMKGDVSMDVTARDVARFPELQEWAGDEPFTGSASIFVEEEFTATLELVVDGADVLAWELTGMEGQYGDWTIACDR
jgi:hypothetical protein